MTTDSLAEAPEAGGAAALSEEKPGKAKGFGMAAGKKRPGGASKVASSPPRTETAPEPEPDPREGLPDDTPVGHGWVVSKHVFFLYKPDGRGGVRHWKEGSREWGGWTEWREAYLPNVRPATVGDLRRVGLPLTEWPDITAPEPEQSEAKAIIERDNAIAALRAIRGQVVLGVCLADPNSDTRKTYRESLKIVEAEARRRGIDLSEEVS